MVVSPVSGFMFRTAHSNDVKCFDCDQIFRFGDALDVKEDVWSIDCPSCNANYSKFNIKK